MRLNVAVVFGGKSVEHEVSVITGTQFMENIDRSKYNPIPVYVSKDNEFYYEKGMHNISFFKEEDLNRIKEKSKKVHWIKEKDGVYLYTVKFGLMKKLFPIDLVVLSVHGTNCEDGTLAAYFNFLDLPFVGSNHLSSSIAQNKIITKKRLEQENIPVVPYVSFYQKDYEYQPIDVIEKCEALSYPMIVKPATLGSSIGITKCEDRDELQQGIREALKYDDEILVEQAIVEMKEYNCAVLGNRNGCRSSLVEEVLKQDDILSYDDKYIGGSKGSKGIVSTKRHIPADIPEELTQQIRELAEKTFQTIGNSGISRIDFIYDDRNKKIYVNEINTIPGSFAYYLWSSEELKYSKLIDELVSIALQDYKRKEKLTFTYDTNILSYADQKLSKLK